MAILNQKRILNLIPKVSAPVTLHVSQGDVGTEIQFTLVKGDELFVDTGNLTASVHGIRHDGANFGVFACTLSGSTVSFPLHSEMSAIKGEALAEIVLVDSQGNKVGSANFGIMVEESVFPLGVSYDNDVSVYESILAYVQGIPAQIVNDYTSKINVVQSNLNIEVNSRTSADSLINTRIDEIIAPSGEAPSAAEVTDARIGENGIIYGSLGTAVREQIAKVNEFSSRTIVEFEQGTIGNTSGNNASNTNTKRVRVPNDKRLRCNGFILPPFHEAAVYVYKGNTFYGIIQQDNSLATIVYWFTSSNKRTSQYVDVSYYSALGYEFRLIVRILNSDGEEEDITASVLSKYSVLAVHDIAEMKFRDSRTLEDEYYYTPIPMISSMYVSLTSYEVGQEITGRLIQNDRMRFAVVPCKEGDRFIISATQHAFLDNAFKLIYRDDTPGSFIEEIVSAPANARWLIMNDRSFGTSYATYKKFALNKMNNFVPGYINSTTGVPYFNKSTGNFAGKRLCSIYNMHFHHVKIRYPYLLAILVYKDNTYLGDLQKDGSLITGGSNYYAGEFDVSSYTESGHQFKITIKRADNGDLDPDTFPESAILYDDDCYSSDKEISLLLVGNSYTEDEFSYVPALLKEVMPHVNFNICILHHGNGTIHDQLVHLQEDTAYPRCDMYNSYADKWVKESDSVKLSDVVSWYNFDIVCINQASTIPTYEEQASDLKLLIDGYADLIGHNVKFMWQFAHTRSNISGYTHQEQWELKRQFTEDVLNKTAISDIFYAGTAIENARTTSLDSLGDVGHLCYDSTQHLQDGLPLLIAAYANVLKIADLIGEKKVGILGSQIRPDDAFDTDQSIPGPHGVSVGVTEANVKLAAKCALAAMKKPFEITDCSVME